jgi:uncharacterized protein (TIRG00374 family)
MKLRRLKYLLHATVFIGLVIAAVKYIDGGEFVAALRHFNWLYAPLILSLTLGYLALKGWRFLVFLRPLAAVSWTIVMRAYVAGQGMTLIPAGVTARAGMLKQLGVPVAKSGAPIALSSLLDQAVFLVGSMLAALWFDAARKPLLVLLAVLAVLSLLLGVEATRKWLLDVVEWIMGKVRLLPQWHGFLASLGEVSKPRLLLIGLALTALAFALSVEALHLAAKGVGAEVPYPTLFLAFILPTMLGRISAMPGGVGVTEAGMVGILAATPGVATYQAAAAVAVFRVGTVFFAALVGAVVYVVGWRGTLEAAET